MTFSAFLATFTHMLVIRKSGAMRSFFIMERGLKSLLGALKKVMVVVSSQLFQAHVSKNVYSSEHSELSKLNTIASCFLICIFAYLSEAFFWFLMSNSLKNIFGKNYNSIYKTFIHRFFFYISGTCCPDIVFLIQKYFRYGDMSVLRQTGRMRYNQIKTQGHVVRKAFNGHKGIHTHTQI